MEILFLFSGSLLCLLCKPILLPGHNGIWTIQIPPFLSLFFSFLFFFFSTTTLGPPFVYVERFFERVISFVRSSIGVETILKFYRGSSIIIAPRRLLFVRWKGGSRRGASGNRASGWNLNVGARASARKCQNTRVEIVDTSYPPFWAHYLTSILPRGEGGGTLSLSSGVFRWLIDATH